MCVCVCVCCVCMNEHMDVFFKFFAVNVFYFHSDNESDKQKCFKFHLCLKPAFFFILLHSHKCLLHEYIILLSPKAAKSDLDNEKLIFSNNVSVPLRQPAHRTFPYGKTKMSYTEALQCLC